MSEGYFLVTIGFCLGFFGASAYWCFIMNKSINNMLLRDGRLRSSNRSLSNEIKELEGTIKKLEGNHDVEKLHNRINNLQQKNKGLAKKLNENKQLQTNLLAYSQALSVISKRLKNWGS